MHRNTLSPLALTTLLCAAPLAGVTFALAAPAPGPFGGFDANGNRAALILPTADSTPRRADTQAGRTPLRGGTDAVWTPFGPTGANARAVAASPTTANLRLAGAGDAYGRGTLYRSTNNGTSWTAVTATGTGSVNDIAFGSTGIAYVATDGGLFRGTVDAQTWATLPVPFTGPQALVRRVITHPTDPGTLWVGMGIYSNIPTSSLIYRSTDGGQTWTDVSPPVTPGYTTTALAIDPANPDRLFAAFAASFGGGAEVYSTTDGGALWNWAGGGLGGNLPPYILWDFAFSGGRVFVAGGQDFGGQFVGLYTSDDNGVSWTERSAGWPSRAATAVAIDPGNSNRVLVGTTRAGLVVSDDGGQTWAFSVGGTGQSQVNDIAFVPGAPANIFLGMSSIAVLRSTDGGASFASASSGISRLNITSFAANPANPSEVAAAFAGDNDGGIFTSTDGGATWTLSSAPTPRWQRVRFGEDGTLYATHDGPLGRADDGLWRRNAGGAWSLLGPGIPSRLDTIGRDIAVRGSTVLLAGREGALLGSDAVIHTYNRLGTGQWETYETGLNLEGVESVLWVETETGPVALAGVVNFGNTSGASGGILRSVDGGRTWSRSQSGIPSAWHVWQLSKATVPGDDDDDEPVEVVYITATQSTLGQGTGAALKSENAGANWTQLGGTAFYRTMIVDPYEAGTIYGARSATGQTIVDRSQNDGASFAPLSTGLLGSGAALLLTHSGEDRRLFLATTSGGFTLQLEVPTPPCPADFNTDGQVTTADITAFLTAWFTDRASGTLAADFNRDSATTTADITAYLSAWFAARAGGC